MADFQFIKKPQSKKWSILDPRRSARPNIAQAPRPICPFCPGNEDETEREITRLTSYQAGIEGASQFRDEWLVRVMPNKFPFASIHELIIHSPDHHKNIDELPVSHVIHILGMYQKRYKVHQNEGTVVLFHNRGEMGGESLPHPHTQLVVLPHGVTLDTPSLRDLSVMPEGEQGEEEVILTEHFQVFCPQTSDWPDEVVIAPRRRKTRYSDMTINELADLATTLHRVLQGLNERLGNEFPFNYYIYPLFDWYLRIVPRKKILGGFEIATNIGVVTHDPAELQAFLRKFFGEYDPHTQ